MTAISGSVLSEPLQAFKPALQTMCERYEEFILLRNRQQDASYAGVEQRTLSQVKWEMDKAQRTLKMLVMYDEDSAAVHSLMMDAFKEQDIQWPWLHHPLYNVAKTFVARDDFRIDESELESLHPMMWDVLVKSEEQHIRNPRGATWAVITPEVQEALFDGRYHAEPRTMKELFQFLENRRPQADLLPLIDRWTTQGYTDTDILAAMPQNALFSPKAARSQLFEANALPDTAAGAFILRNQEFTVFASLGVFYPRWLFEYVAELIETVQNPDPTKFINSNAPFLLKYLKAWYLQVASSIGKPLMDEYLDETGQGECKNLAPEWFWRLKFGNVGD